MTGQPQRVHNRFKLPFFIGCVVLGTLAAVYGATSGHWGLVVPCALAALASLVPIWMIVAGRGNPSWMRSPLDPDPPSDSADR